MDGIRFGQESEDLGPHALKMENIFSCRRKYVFKDDQP
jgi:hypothetical protein